MLHQLVHDLMRHRETHLDSPYSRCNRKGKCQYGFPQPIRLETMIDDYGRVQYRRRSKDDAWIVSHIPALLKYMQCHIHVGITFTVNAVLYLYKYLYKGPDVARFAIDLSHEAPQNEFDDYQLGRFLSSSEAAWRILNYHMTKTTPSVIAIGIHLPNRQLGQLWRTMRTSSISDLLLYLHQPASPGTRLAQGLHKSAPIFVIGEIGSRRSPRFMT